MKTYALQMKHMHSHLCAAQTSPNTSDLLLSLLIIMQNTMRTYKWLFVHCFLE